MPPTLLHDFKTAYASLRQAGWGHHDAMNRLMAPILPDNATLFVPSSSTAGLPQVDSPEARQFCKRLAQAARQSDTDAPLEPLSWLAGFYEASLSLRNDLRGTRQQSAGAWYTHDLDVRSLVDAVLDAYLESEPASTGWTVCDPAVGCGNFLQGFLAALADRLPHLSNPPDEVLLAGVDVDPDALAVARHRLNELLGWWNSRFPAGPRLSFALKEGDSISGIVPATPSSFSWERAFPEVFAAGGFDLIVTNPPYLRHEELGQDFKRALPAVRELLAASPDGRTDLYGYFILASPHWLKGEGAAGLLVSDSWLDTLSGKGIRLALLQGQRPLSLAFDFASRSFEEPGVQTMQLVLCPEKGPSPPLTFHRRRLATLNSHHQTTETLQVTSATSEEKWGARYLRWPSVLSPLVESAFLRTAGSFLDFRYGTKPGLTAFFVLPQADTVEAEFSIPFLTSTRQVLKPRLTRNSPLSNLFVCPYSAKELTDRGASKTLSYIEQAQERLTLKRSKHTVAGTRWSQAVSLRGNRPEWHCLRPPAPGPLVFPCILGTRLFVAYNPDSVPVSNNFFVATPKAGVESEFVAGILNSSLGLLALETFGRTKGLGGLNLYGYDLGQMLLPHPGSYSTSQREDVTRAFRELAAEPIDDVAAFGLTTDGFPRCSSLRTALDAAVLAPLSKFSAPLHVEEIQSLLHTAVTLRIRRSRPPSR